MNQVEESEDVQMVNLLDRSTESICDDVKIQKPESGCLAKDHELITDFNKAEKNFDQKVKEAMAKKDQMVLLDTAEV